MLFVGDLDETGIHVQSPTDVIFLCGGVCSDSAIAIPLSLRDAFLKIGDNPVLRDRSVILAEKITKQTFFGDHYKDLLLFETHLAQITGLILLFCESAGSLAELGAFSAVQEIAKRLMVIIRSQHWNVESFVRLGPLRSLENQHGESAICVLDDLDIGLLGESFEHVQLNILRDQLQIPLEARLQISRERSTFDPQRPGHVIKLIVGLIQEWGALTLDEITALLESLGVQQPPSLEAYLLCAAAVNWITKKRKGFVTYYVARNLPEDAAQFTMKRGAKVRNKTRRRLMIREDWKKTDGLRAATIREIFEERTP